MKNFSGPKLSIKGPKKVKSDFIVIKNPMLEGLFNMESFL
jgi:hypothetical protein